MHFPKTSPMEIAKRAVHPYLPFLTRMLLISSFIDNASQTLLDYTHHAEYLDTTHHIPAAVALFMIAVSTMTSFLACTMVFLKPLQRRGVYLLLCCLLYQHVIYGFPSSHSHSSFFAPPTLVRDLCLVFTLLLLGTQSSSSPVSDYVPITAADRHRPSKTNQDSDERQQHITALATRFMFAVIALDMSSRVASFWIIAPVALAFMFGFMTDIVGVFLIVFYTLFAFASHKFWLVDSSSHVYAAFERHATRFEFVHTFSLISGLLLLFMTGPGDLSVDNRLKRYNASHLPGLSHGESVNSSMS